MKRLLIVFLLYFLLRYFVINGRTTDLNIDLRGKNILITGASDGIGKETVKFLSQMGANVILACRNETKTKKVIAEIKRETGNKNLEYLYLDLSDLESVYYSVENFKKKNITLDVLINNAGIQVNVEDKLKTKQGYEMMFGVNYLGHYMLNRVSYNLLLTKSC